jgi:hypothetical protein
MRAGIEITITPEDRRHVEVIACDRNAKLKHVARPKVILATADGCGTMEVMRHSGLSKPDVWRWQERFMHAGVDGLLRDKTRDLLCHAHETAAPAGSVPLDYRPLGGHTPLHHGAQHRAQAVRVDRRSRPGPRCHQQRETSL